MKKVIINNIPYWVDDNENKWNAIRTSEGDAEHCSKTLVYCVRCIDCSYCINCKDCIDCTNCTECSCCYSCNKCIFCIECDNCDSCCGCRICESCTACHQCIYCYVCYFCLLCEYCGDCKRKFEDKYFRYGQQMDDIKEEDINTGDNNVVEVEDTLEGQDEAGKNV